MPIGLEFGSGLRDFGAHQPQFQVSRDYLAVDRPGIVESNSQPSRELQAISDWSEIGDLSFGNRMVRTKLSPPRHPYNLLVVSVSIGSESICSTTVILFSFQSTCFPKGHPRKTVNRRLRFWFTLALLVRSPERLPIKPDSVAVRMAIYVEKARGEAQHHI
jgi:hypothetical protein